METVKKVKRVQVKGARHLVVAEDAEIEKLVHRGLSLKKKMDEIKGDLESVQGRIIEIARSRREGSTTITLEGISLLALITFRDSYQVNDDVEDIKQPLGPLFDRFFTKKEEYKTTGDFKKFMTSDHALGIENSEKVKKAILKYVSTKETKPSVKMEKKEND